MELREAPPEVQDDLTKLVTLQARRLRVGQDTADVEQALWLRLAVAWQRFDSARGNPRQFATTVVRNALASIARDRRALKRVRTANSLERFPAGTFDEHASRRHRGVAATSDLDGVDFADAIASLPESLRPVAELLRLYSPAEAARRLGIDRSALAKRRRDLAGWFRDAGLAENF